MQKPSESILAQVRALSIAERSFLSAYIEGLAAFGPPDGDRPKRGRPRKQNGAQEEIEKPVGSWILQGD